MSSVALQRPVSEPFRRAGSEPLRAFGLMLAYAAAFFVLLALARSFNQTTGVSLWYPAAGLRLAALLVLGLRFAPGVVAAEIAAVVCYGMLAPEPGFASVNGAIGAAIAPVVYSLAAFVLVRHVGIDVGLRRFRDVAAIAAAAIAVPFLAAVGNRLWQARLGTLSLDDFLPSILSFLIGDTVGILMLTPCVLVVIARSRFSGQTSVERPPISWMRLFVDFVAVWLFLVLAYRLPEWLDAVTSNVNWYPAFLPMIWISFRHGLIGSIAGILAITTGAAWLTYPEAQSLRFQDLQIFVLCLSITGLLMGSVVTAMRSSEKILKDQNRELQETRSKLRRNNAELQSRNVELEQLTYAASHDLKTPLVTIHGFLGMLQKDIDSRATDQVRRDLGHIRSAAEKASRLLDELHEVTLMSRAVRSAREVAVADLVEEALLLNAERIAARRVAVEVSSELPVIVCDRVRMLVVFRLLIDNAVRFLGDQPDPRIEIGARESEDGQVTIYVRDNGIGVDPRYHDKIFSLFERLDPQSGEGTGVSLALVERVVRVHGGKAWVESQGIGHGSTFCIALPAAPGVNNVEELLAGTSAPPSAGPAP